MGAVGLAKDFSEDKTVAENQNRLASRAHKTIDDKMKAKPAVYATGDLLSETLPAPPSAARLSLSVFRIHPSLKDRMPRVGSLRNEIARRNR